MSWLEPKEAMISVQSDPFSCGGLRNASAAKAISSLVSGKYVLKKYEKYQNEDTKNHFGTIQKLFK